MKEVILAMPRGFCSGVERALNIVENQLTASHGKPVCVLHEIVHNDFVVNHLKQRGVRFVETPSGAPENSVLIFSAHGVSRAVEEEARKRNVKLLDATCPLVKSVHKKAEELSGKGYSILLFGKKGHREVEGILGRIQGNVSAYLLENESDVESFPVSSNEKYACLSQTTLNAKELERMIQLLRKRIPSLLIVGNVCHATEERQKAVTRLAECCDTVLIVGSVKSSNSMRLYELACAGTAHAWLVAHPDELDSLDLTGSVRIGIASGASAPERLVRETLRKIEQLGFTLKNMDQMS